MKLQIVTNLNNEVTKKFGTFRFGWGANFTHVSHQHDV